MDDRYDVVVVGARVAGASVALLAARAGRRVLLVDRVGFPSDTLSTNYIHQSGVARLRRWGVLEKLIATGCPILTSTRLQSGDIVVEGGVSATAIETRALAPRRYVLDALLVNAAADAGVTVQQKVSVTELERNKAGRPTGVVLGAGSRRRMVHASLIVGADGMRSTIARLVDSPTTRRDPRLTCAYYSFWAGLEAGYELYDRCGAWVGAVPTHDAVLVAAYFPQDRFAEVRGGAAHALWAAAEATAPDLARRMREAEQVERLWGTGDQQNFFRQAAGPGWALVGDSGHHKDSITARGITDALTQAELLVSRTASVLDDPATLDAQLLAYWRDRDALMEPGYQATLQTAVLNGWQERSSLLRVIASDPGLTAAYFDVVAGLAPAGDLMAQVREMSAASEPSHQAT